MTSLSICIPSYNRPHELIRSLSSISIPNHFKYEIVVVDDCSPSQAEISDRIAELNHPRVKYFPLSENIGYDLNLIKCAELASNDYILYLSDDDTLYSPAIPFLFNYLENNSADLLTTAYQINGSDRHSRTYQCVKKFSPKNSIGLASILYNFVLFSGLVVKRESLLALLPLNLDSLIYSQIVWSGLLAINNGYTSLPFVLVVPYGDGLIGFGSNTSQQSCSLLSNRNSLMSPITYHEHLFNSIKYLSDNARLPRLLLWFSFEYTLRSYYLMRRAFLIGGRRGLTSFAITLTTNKNIHIFLPVVVFYYLLVFLFGQGIDRFTKKVFRSSPSELYRLIRGGD